VVLLAAGLALVHWPLALIVLALAVVVLGLTGVCGAADRSDALNVMAMAATVAQSKR
jgi:hypothetical protein